MSQQMIEFQRFVHRKCAGATHLTQNNIAGAVRCNTNQGSLGAVEIITSRIKSRGQIPTISRATPSEVEMEVVVVVSVAHETVAATSRTTVQDRDICVKILAKQGVPCMVGEVALCRITKIWVETEEVDQSGTSVHVVRTAFCGAIHHVHRHPAVAHQCGNRIHLGRSAGSRKGSRHVGIIIIHTIVVCRQYTIAAGIAVDTAAMYRKAPIIDDLRHGGGHTAREDVPVRTVGVSRTQTVVVICLIPGCRQQWSHCVAVSGVGNRLSGSQSRPFAVGFR